MFKSLATSFKDLATSYVAVVTIGTGVMGAGFSVLISCAIAVDDLRTYPQRQQAQQWDGRTPLECFAAGKAYTVRAAGLNDLEIFEAREKIASGTCRLSTLIPG